MTGKQQKERNELKELKKRLDIPMDKRQKIIDEAVHPIGLKYQRKRNSDK